MKWFPLDSLLWEVVDIHYQERVRGEGTESAAILFLLAKDLFPKRGWQGGIIHETS